jgi:hypothetical protein
MEAVFIAECKECGELHDERDEGASSPCPMSADTITERVKAVPDSRSP